MGAYDLDFHAWAMEQAELLRSRSADAIDWANLAEEIESLGRRERSELRSRLSVLMAHLLKWEFQPRRRTRSWSNTIRTQRRASRRHLEENPSLKDGLGELWAQAYDDARDAASTQTRLGLDVFPVEPPFTLEQTLDPDWLPADAGAAQSSPGANGS